MEIIPIFQKILILNMSFKTNSIKNIEILLLRGLSGLFPLLISFFVPLIQNDEYSSSLFYYVSLTIIGSIILRIGIDQIILKKSLSVDNLHSLLYTFLVNLIFISLFILIFFNEYFNFIISIGFFSFNTIISSYFLTNNKHRIALFNQFIIPNILILIFAKLGIDQITLISLSYGLPLIFIVVIYEKKIFRIKKIFLKYIIDINNFNLTLYGILSILVSNTPILIADHFLDSSSVVNITQSIRLIGLSSFISSVIVFSYNSIIRTLSFNKYLINILILFLPLLLLNYFVIHSVIFLLNYQFNLFNFNIIYISLIITYIIQGNLIGHFLMLKSNELYNFISILLGVIFVILFHYFQDIIFTYELIFSYYISVLIIEASFKLFSFLYLKYIKNTN